MSRITDDDLSARVGSYSGRENSVVFLEFFFSQFGRHDCFEDGLGVVTRDADRDDLDGFIA